MADSERKKRGLAVRTAMFGEPAEPSENFKDIMEVTNEHLFGDIWTREGLSPRDRSLITCATLTALAREGQLKVHIKGALSNGVTREEIKEMMIHLAHYSGWPTGMIGTRIADEVFRELDEEK